MYYVVFNSNSGEIYATGTGEVTSPDLSIFPDDAKAVPTEFKVLFDLYYIENDVPKSKTKLGIVVDKSTIISDGTDEVIISNIPAGVTVEWPDGEIDEVTDGEVRFAVDLPGTYTLIFDAVPYLRQEVAIEAVAAT